MPSSMKERPLYPSRQTLLWYQCPLSANCRHSDSSRTEEIDCREEIQIDPDAGIKAQRDAALEMELVFGHFAHNPVVVEEEPAILDQRVARAASWCEDQKGRQCIYEGNH